MKLFSKGIHGTERIAFGTGGSVRSPDCRFRKKNSDHFERPVDLWYSLFGLFCVAAADKRLERKEINVNALEE